MKDLPPDRFHEIDALFDEALTRPPEEREAFLLGAAGDDSGLLREVRTLLEAEAAAERELGDSATSYAPEFFDRLAASLEVGEAVDALPAGTRVGAHRILREIGRGGMGAVYLAERADEEFRHRVAVKVVKRGLDTDEVLHRFRHERQILATLEHPHIARLYGGGVTDDGRPYLVMEYVEGRPIDVHCEEEDLGLRERLDLFLDACGAVQFAHQSLVVHRDLKPSNVLVTTDGTPKLLDFGIAKLLSDDPDLSALRTRTGVRVLTPRFAAPEQITGGRVTTATDVYALGVLLYELLAGASPYRATREGGNRDLEREILEADPAPPSRVAPEPLRRRLRGDLDNIVLKAMEKDPGRRYATARQLEEDIRRHLAGQPILARAHGWGYRAGRFVRRHRTGVAAAALVVLSLVGGLGAAAWQGRVAAAERDAAEEVSGFLVDLFRSADPFGEGERLDTMRVADLLERAEERVRSELGDRPVVQARMLGVLGGVNRSLGRLPEARPLLEASLERRGALHGAESREAAEARHELAGALMDLAEYDEAERLFRRALEARRRHRDASAAAETLTQLGELLRQRSRFEEAREALQEALRIRRSLAGGSEESEEAAAVLNSLASTHQDEGGFVEAEALRRRVLEIRRRVHGPDHPLVADALSNLAAVLVQLERGAEAEAIQREALARYRTALEEPHPKIANALNTLGTLLTDLGDHAGAQATLREALAMRRALYGEEHPMVASTLNNLGYELQTAGDLRRAEETYRASLALRRRLHGEEHIQVAIGLNSLSAVLNDQERYEEAEPLAREAVTIAQELLGPQPATAVLKGNWASALRGLGRREEAAAAYAASVEVLDAALPPDHPRTARMRLRLGGTLRELARYEAAEPVLLEAARVLGEEQETVEELAALYVDWGRPAEAVAWRGRAASP